MSDESTLSMEELFDQPLQPAPWPLSRAVLDLSLAALPVVTDDLATRLIIEMATTIADLREEMQAVRAVQSAALNAAHQQHLEIVRLRTYVAELRAQRRAA